MGIFCYVFSLYMYTRDLVSIMRTFIPGYM